MKWLLLALLVFVASLILGIEMTKVPSYVLVVIGQYSYETSWWVALLLLIAGFLAGYAVVRFVIRLIQAPHNFMRWQQRRRMHKARQQTQLGLCLLAEGEWPQAEDALLAGAKHKKKALINYLAAAKAAQAQQAYERRDEYLRKAHAANPNATIAIGVTQAQLQIDAQQWEQALATLEHLHSIAGTHRHILRLLVQVYVHCHEWTRCEKLLAALHKYAVLPTKELQNLERTVYLNMLMEAGQRQLPHLTQIWKSLPSHWQQQEDFQCHYVDYLLHAHQDETAMRFIEHTLKKQWNTLLLLRYSQLQHPHDPDHLMHTAVSWLKKHERDANLLLCLSRLAARASLWDQAKHYLQQSVDLRPSAISYTELGDLCQLQQDHEAAQRYFRQALALLL